MTSSRTRSRRARRSSTRPPTPPTSSASTARTSSSSPWGSSRWTRRPGPTTSRAWTAWAPRTWKPRPRRPCPRPASSSRSTERPGAGMRQDDAGQANPDPAPGPAIDASRPWSVRMADVMRWAAIPLRRCAGTMRMACCSGRSPGWARPPASAVPAGGHEAIVDQFVEPDGTIRTYALDEYNLDQINPGRLLFAAYRDTGEERYRQAIGLLREQLRRQPRTSEGGFWHKLIYPHQMWLDGIYMACPFLAQYAADVRRAAAFDDVARQILLIARHTHDEPQRPALSRLGREPRSRRGRTRSTGCSPHFWGRAVGWYLMAMVDVLDFLPAGSSTTQRDHQRFRPHGTGGLSRAGRGERSLVSGAGPGKSGRQLLRSVGIVHVRLQPGQGGKAGLRGVGVSGQSPSVAFKGS